MIDEKKIQETAILYATGSMLYENHRMAFAQGAKWALEQSRWIAGCPDNSNLHVFQIEFRVNGKPTFEILVGYIDGNNGKIYYQNDEWAGWTAKEVVKYHMPLPEPPKQ